MGLCRETNFFSFRYEGFTVMCQTEEDLGVLILSGFIVITHVSGKERREKGVNGAWVRGPKMGQLTLSMGPAKAEVRIYIIKSHHSK